MTVMIIFWYLPRMEAAPSGEITPKYPPDNIPMIFPMPMPDDDV
jgi:hypothetical protein